MIEPTKSELFSFEQLQVCEAAAQSITNHFYYSMNSLTELQNALGETYRAELVEVIPTSIFEPLPYRFQVHGRYGVVQLDTYGNLLPNGVVGNGYTLR